MRRRSVDSWVRVALPLIVLAAGQPAMASDDVERAAKVEFFERQVRPMLEKHCSACHSAETKPAGGLRVDDRNGLLAGGNSGAAIVPGKPEESLLLQRVAAGAKRRMPAEGEPLDDDQLAVLARWIADGAAWPEIQVTVYRDSAGYDVLRRDHWAWQPLAETTVPSVHDAAWPSTDVDRFVLARLEAESLAPVPDADRTTWLRRVTYDLTGLPPTPAELDAFLSDERPTAFEHVVDRLLESPAFGEQWGRHWLDLARFGESTGPSRNIPYPHAWRYRDYVIDALNQDLPWNQFIREQVAGDLLPAADDAQRNRQRIATGFLALGVKDVNQRFQVRFEMDNVDEQIDVVTRSVLGLTVSCARCHDHMFDPVPQADYYALAGIFTSTELYDGLRNQMGGSGLAYYVPKRLVRLAADLPPVDPMEVERLTAQVRDAQQKWDAVRGTPEGRQQGPDGVPHQRSLKLQLDELQGRLSALTDPAEQGLAVHGVQESAQPGDTALRVRGEAEKLGPAIPRGFLTAFPVPGTASVPADQSGRLELAKWLASDANPLAARVFVNRVWAKLFGRGIVSTVDNFGTAGDSPSHPELLDHLAAQTVADGWSLKRLVRRLVLSRAYRLSSAASSEHLARDPANRLLWRHAPRRLTAEEFRDSLLAAAGTLDRSRPQGSPAQKFKMAEIRDDGPEARSIHEQADAARLRSVYLPQLRGVTPKALEPFDPVQQALVSGSREVTTVPGQALFLLNSPFVQRQSHELALRLGREDQPESERIRAAYRLTVGREPAQDEIARAAAFLDDFTASYRDDSAVAAGPLETAESESDKTASEVEAAVNSAEAQPSGSDLPEEQSRSADAGSVDARSADARSAAWQALAQALFASAEFRYVR